MAIDIKREDEHSLRILLSKTIDVFKAGELAEILLPDEGHENVQKIIVDCQNKAKLETAAISVLSVAKMRLENDGIDLVLENQTKELEDLMREIPAANLDRQAPEKPSFFEQVGDQAFAGYGVAAEFIELMFDATRAFFSIFRKDGRPPKGSIIEQCIYTGVDALPIILLLSALIGLILGFQAAFQLQQFGAAIFIADLVGISGVREFSPLMTAIIIAGRSGASIAAELGTMKVQEEIDALKSMGLNPLRFLVLPRISGLIITLPALTLISSFIVIGGGLTIANLMLDIPAISYLKQTVKVVKFTDWTFGISKSYVFAWIIATVGCYCGMSIRGGASEVGNATTRSVVASIFLLIVIDSFFATASTLLKM